MNDLTIATCIVAAVFAVPALAQAPAAMTDLHLKYAVFDPATEAPELPNELRGAADTNLWIVQFESVPTESTREAVRSSGGAIFGYLPHNAYVVRMLAKAAFEVRDQTAVRSVTHYHPAFRLESALRTEIAAGGAPKRRYNVVVVDKHNDKPALTQRIRAIGGSIDSENAGSLLFEVTLDNAQLIQAARFDEVLWIDRWGAPEDDMDNARIQGGANYVENIAGYTGMGITGHQMEGLNPFHSDWNNTPIGYPSACSGGSGHGHSTAGIVYGNGNSSALARGMAPDAQCIFTSCRGNRYANLQNIITQYEAMFTTASWGSPRTRQYTSVSAEVDDICFDLDLVWTNSQSNAGNQDSRAEAWAKNVIACGGVDHGNNSNPADDSWQAGNASIGPAADGRTKPDLCAYYDSIATSSLTNFTLSFGGTSGATPIVAGHNALAIEMYTDGLFGNTLRNPGGSRFSNKPKFPTLKALQIVSADQYPFAAMSTDNRREHQGYGFPNLRNMYDDRQVMFIVDEEDVLAIGQGTSYTIAVAPNRPSLKISMSFAEPAANPAATQAAVNDLSLRVTSPDGTLYWGNIGLDAGVWSTPGGTRDRINTAEQVFVENPLDGNWTVDVVAHRIVQDAHVETPAVDADYGLVVRGGTLVSSVPIVVPAGSISKYGQACPSSVVLPPICAGVNTGGGGLTFQARSSEYALETTTPNAISVGAFEIYTGSATGGNLTHPAALYFGTNGPSGAAVATTTITIGSTPGVYRATFSTPVTIPAGQTFYCSVSHNNSYIPSLAAGDSGTAYFRSGLGTWSLSTSLTRPTFRVICSGPPPRQVPAFDLTGTPLLGGTLNADLVGGAPNVPASMLIGFSDSILRGLPLPFDFTPLGAPGCFLLTSGHFPFAHMTDANGEVHTGLVIPNDQSILGWNAFFQFFMIDIAANSLGLVSSEGAKLTIGS